MTFLDLMIVRKHLKPNWWSRVTGVLCIPEKPILQDVPTRWGSSRASTESFLDSKKESDDDAGNTGEGGSNSDVFSKDFENMEAINEALRKIKYKKPQKLSDFLLSRTDMLRIKRVHQFLTNLDIFNSVQLSVVRSL